MNLILPILKPRKTIVFSGFPEPQNSGLHRQGRHDHYCESACSAASASPLALSPNSGPVQLLLSPNRVFVSFKKTSHLRHQLFDVALVCSPKNQKTKNRNVLLQLISNNFFRPRWTQMVSCKLTSALYATTKPCAVTSFTWLSPLFFGLVCINVC